MKCYEVCMRIKERMRDRCETALFVDFRKQWFTEDDFSTFTHSNFVIFDRIFTFVEVEQANFCDTINSY